MTTQHEWVGKRAVRIDKDGRRLPGEYVIADAGGDTSYSPTPTFLDLRRTDGKPTQLREGFSRRRVRVEGIDTDFVELLAEVPDTHKLSADEQCVLLRSLVREILATKLEVRSGDGTIIQCIDLSIPEDLRLRATKLSREPGTKKEL